MPVRKPAVAGTFYPDSKEDLEEAISESFSRWDSPDDSKKIKDLKAIVVPHAGYQYSGYVAAAVYNKVPDIDTAVIFGPNHTGLGPKFSVYPEGVWETPLGQVGIDSELAGAIIDSSKAEADESAHRGEHSIEVQLPFLQTILKSFDLVPMCIKNYEPSDGFLESCREVGETVAKAIGKRRALLIASTDFTHYELKESAESKDELAMKQILKLDEAGLFKAVAEHDITMCGFGGVAVVLSAAKALGAKKSKKIAYMTSGDVIGGNEPVVGYGGIAVF